MSIAWMKIFSLTKPGRPWYAKKLFLADSPRLWRVRKIDIAIYRERRIIRIIEKRETKAKQKIVVAKPENSCIMFFIG